MGEVTMETLLALQQSIPGVARRAVQVPTFRFGTVQSSFTSSELSVLVDGDTELTTVQSAIGAPLVPGGRVLVCYYPPQGVIVLGALGSSSPPGGLVGSFMGDGAGFTAATTLGTLAPIPTALYADRVYRAYITAPWRASDPDTTMNVDLDLQPTGAGTWPTTLRSFRGTTTIASVTNSTETIAGHVDFTPAEDGFYDARAVGSRLGGTGLLTINANSLRVSIDDVGAL